MIPATPGFVIAAPRSGSGKTTLTLGLLRAFARRGLRVAGAKCGPDYIDPAFHAAATGRPSFNLDTWAMEPSLVTALAARSGAECDLVICEGLMGLFDGVPAEAGRSGSSADVAAALGWPVLLIHDVGGQSQSAAAQIKGCRDYDPRIRIAGVVLNRVGSERHRRLVTDGIASFGLPVLGALPRSSAIALPERHLGLVQAEETTELMTRLDAMADFVEAHVDLDAVLALATRGQPDAAAHDAVPVRPPGQHIAIARDSAFSFLYPHVLTGWRDAGAALSFFSPLADEAPATDCDCAWLPGGYPELHAAQLASCRHFLDGMRTVATSRPVHGECGGYMVLGRSLTDASGTAHAMLGLLGLETSFGTRKLHLGYRDASLLADSRFGPAGTRLRGHEFHYATVTSDGGDAALASVQDAYASPPTLSGTRRGNVTGSFFHAIAALREESGLGSAVKLPLSSKERN
ncbi:cobyrinate a,c-diamide synthase [Lichenihabitans sp. PAMC28606]|uniref:cobyrinate a,c-diamide synthase n=1 Tax=Lichenihabitans sp. PAMC28606 TaxID=2880932 RepID=UPI001D0A352D|nr:cobyrinate a,c-diamide synthase [Lichenihabitans sp. PAMC28606]UDL94990.1 cobyrinate a,c-diamide synthase [Lichenihabitans sp. PAMC28606]